MAFRVSGTAIRVYGAILTGFHVLFFALNQPESNSREINPKKMTALWFGPRVLAFSYKRTIFNRTISRKYRSSRVRKSSTRKQLRQRAGSKVPTDQVYRSDLNCLNTLEETANATIGHDGCAVCHGMHNCTRVTNHN